MVDEITRLRDMIADHYTPYPCGITVNPSVKQAIENLTKKYTDAPKGYEPLFQSIPVFDVVNQQCGIIVWQDDKLMINYIKLMEQDLTSSKWRAE